MSSGLNKWAPHTWVFFHCFANKINKRFFRRKSLPMFTSIEKYLHGFAMRRMYKTRDSIYEYYK